MIGMLGNLPVTGALQAYLIQKCKFELGLLIVFSNGLNSILDPALHCISLISACHSCLLPTLTHVRLSCALVLAQEAKEVKL